MGKAKRRSAGSHLSFKVSGLAPGRVYCFVVRAKNGSIVGAPPAHTCKPTVRSQGATSGATYTVMTYNVCSYKGGTRGCDRFNPWNVRGPRAKRLIPTKEPDVVAAQESDYLDALDGYAMVFHKAGYWDAYDLAGSLIRPNCNSYNGFRNNPIISQTWGDHIDHIWVKTSIGVGKWEGVAFYPKGRYTTLPSDHSPVAI